jgi:uncharacterized protein YaiE (UPF0345 family)
VQSLNVSLQSAGQSPVGVKTIGETDYTTIKVAKIKVL